MRNKILNARCNMSTYGEGQRNANEVHPVSSDICMQKFIKYAKVLKRKFLHKDGCKAHQVSG